MIFSSYITTPKNTPLSSLQHTTLKVAKGLVYKVEIMFPPGSAGLLRVAIFDGGTQLWPSTLGEFFRGEGFTISFDDTYLKLADPFQFDIFTYNLDETWDHSIDIRIGLVSKEIFMARFLPTYAWQEFRQILEETQKAQEALQAEQRQAIIEQGLSSIIPEVETEGSLEVEFED